MESLWRLPAFQLAPVRDTQNEVSFCFDNRVRCGHCHVNRFVSFQHLDDVIYDSLTHQGTYRIMENQINVFSFISADSREAGMIPFFSSLEYFLYFFPAVLDNDGFDVGNIEGVGDNGYFIYMRITLECVDGMLHHHFPRNLEKLFRG